MSVSSDNRDLGFDPREFNADPVERAYRDALGDGLEEVLNGGVETLQALVKGLNDISVTAPGGEPWTEATLQAELDRLGR